MCNKYIAKSDTKDKEEDNFKDDYVAKSIGAFGLWQFLYVTIATLARFFGCWNATSIIFLTPPTEFVCKLFRDNVTVDVNNNTCYSNCVKYEYANNVFEETLITEYDLICNNAWLASFAQSVMMLGIVIGITFYGWLSDRLGRSRGIFFCGINCLIFQSVTYFCRSFWMIIALRFFMGLGTGGIYTLTAVFVSEVVGTKYVHIVLSVILPVMDGLSLITMAGFAYVTTSWKIFTGAYSIATLILVALTFFLPESPRWLIAKNKVKEAVHVMTNAAKLNKMEISNIQDNVREATERNNKINESAMHYTYLHLFRNKKNAVWTLAFFVVWVATGFTYFGLIQYTSKVGFNIYVAVTILGIFQILVSLKSIAVTSYFRRKPSAIYIFLILSITQIILVFIPKGCTAAAIVATMGTVAANTVFTVIYIHVVELYPTPMRNMGLSLCSVGAKGAAILSPFVANLGDQVIVSLTFAAISIVAALVYLVLPETKGKCLQDTVD